MGAMRSVSDLKADELEGKTVLVRVNLDLLLDVNPLTIYSTNRLAAVRTITYLREHRARVILCGHLGRPVCATPEYSLRPHVQMLSLLLGVEVNMADDCIGEGVQNMVAAIRDGGVLLLENVRFHKEEEENDPEFAKRLASLADVYVNDDFATAHSAHASTEGMAKYFKTSVSGFLMQKELDFLVGPVSNPKKPVVAIVGGSSLSAVNEVIDSGLQKADAIILGGEMIHTFYEANGDAVGSSSVENNQVGVAELLMKKAKDKEVTLILPTHAITGNKRFAASKFKVVSASGIPLGSTGTDVGPDYIKTFLAAAGTILWSGTMDVAGFGVEIMGTEAYAMTLAGLKDKGVVTIVGGADSIAALKKLGLADRMSHITTGFGACIEFLKEKSLPAVAVLDAKNKGGIGRKAKKLAKTMLNKGKALVVTVIGSIVIVVIKDAIKRCGCEGSNDDDD